MKLHMDYNAEERLKLFSKRLKLFHQHNNERNINTAVVSDDLKYNLSPLLAEIILNLKYPDTSVKRFKKHITKYNGINNTNLLFDNFEKLNWVRIIDGEVRLPEVVRHTVWKMGYEEEQGNSNIIHEQYSELLDCLKNYYYKIMYDNPPIITSKKLNLIIKSHQIKEIDIQFLVEREILKVKNSSYYWQEGEYCRKLSSKIAAQLWLKIADDSQDIEKFSKYFKLTQSAEISPHNISDYLSNENRIVLSELALKFLLSQNDFLRSNDEFGKIWLDSPQYLHIDLNKTIPKVDFDYSDLWSFLESIKNHRLQFSDIFEHQKCRNYCHALLRYVIDGEKFGLEPFNRLKDVVKDIQRPFLSYVILQDIKWHYPEIIPHFLTDSDLSPISFQLLDDVNIDSALFKGEINNDINGEQCSKIKNDLWIEMYDLMLYIVAQSNIEDSEKGTLIGRILMNSSEKTFYNAYNAFLHNQHLVYKARYEEILKKLMDKRTNFHVRSAYPYIAPRFIFYILPTICKMIEQKLQHPETNRNGFLNFQTWIIDLSIEVLRLTRLSPWETEIPDRLRGEIMNHSNKLIEQLHNSIKDYYLTTSIVVNDFEVHEEKIIPANRDLNEFGIEIVDWGYLCLILEDKNLLESLNNSFIRSLEFKTDGDRYDKENNEQVKKIQMYLQTLMFAYLAISKRSEDYKMAGMPVRITLQKLQNWIKEYAIKYSVEDLVNSRTDIFDEKLKFYTYNKYQQSLIKLLFSSVNNFEINARAEFINHYFTINNDFVRMLTATNILETKEDIQIIENKIKTIDIEGYIREQNYNEIQRALIEAVNSENHWQLAKPLLVQAKKRFEKIKQLDDSDKWLLFEIDLLLAFKERDIEKLSDIQIPSSNHHTDASWYEITKEYYVALFKLYNEKKYKDSVTRFTALASKAPKDIRYAYHLFRAQTLNAIETE